MKKLLIATLATVMATSAMADWTKQVQKDDFAGTSNTFIISDRVQPNVPMSFPYSNPVVYLYWDCSGETFIMRNTASNLLGGTPSSYGSFSTFYVSMKVDGVIKRNVSMAQSWGSDFIQINNKQMYTDTSSSIANAKKEIVIQLEHFGDGLRHYTFDLTGLDKSQCNK